ncbi:DNA repair protein XRCC3-like isoform X2 [Aphidius gifuensis]|uniref:DNA repair protein XRCC3-like isoform X2 n=1 Tax=Aphidius gifuensis TaxID=684658 RepID=UPI001CDD735C|nr:DNA repair protein XRCC3-like isoform X2 [Aphidius gifuensis]
MDSYKTAKDLRDSDDFLTTGCDKIDALLRGGLSRRGINEIYGEAGCGKTQLALQLCLSSQIKKSNDQSTYTIYICTESIFPSKRLQELLKTSTISKSHKVSSDYILVEHVSKVTELETCILEKIPTFLSNKKRKLGLIIIDSIAAAYRVEYEENKLKNRAKSLRTIGHALHKYSRLFNVSAVMDNPLGSFDHCQKLQPTLGLTWASQVTNSFCLCRFGDVRHFHVRDSSYLPRSTMSFEITTSGVQGLTDIT